MRPAAAATATAVAAATKSISRTESLELVRCLLRVSVFHVAHLRGLFPDSDFKSVTMANLDGLSIQMLTPSCPASKALVEWVEHGVADALRRGYLRKLTFGVAADASCSCLLEEYVFHFGYGDDGATPLVVGMSSLAGAGENNESQGQNSSKNGNNNNNRRRPSALVRAATSSTSTVSSVKYQIVRLIRTLVQVCHTLDAVPEDRFLFMKLAYRDEVTPVDYEPPCFRAAAAPSSSSSSSPGAFNGCDAGGDPLPGERAAFFPRKPFAIEAGKVQTADHAVVICVKSTLDGAAPAIPAPAAAAAAAAAALAAAKKGNKGGEKEKKGDKASGLLFSGSQPVPEDEAEEDEGDEDASMTDLSEDENEEGEGEVDDEMTDSGKVAAAAAAAAAKKKPASDSGFSASRETLERVRAWVAAKAKAAAMASAAAAAAAAVAEPAAAAVAKRGGRRGAGRLAGTTAAAASSAMPPPPPPAVSATLTDALIHFYDAPSADIRAALEALVGEGVLAEAAGGDEEFVVVVGGGGGGGGAANANAATNDEVEATGRRLAALSCHGGVASAAGTEKTASLVAEGKENRNENASAPSVAPEVHFEESQPSPSRAVNAVTAANANAKQQQQQPSRKRKLSIVKAPIETVKGVNRVFEVAAAAAAGKKKKKSEVVAPTAATEQVSEVEEAEEEEEEEAAAVAPAKRAARGRGGAAAAAVKSVAAAKITARRRK